MDITVVWAAIIAFGLAMYVLLDGFDLGIGILFPLFPRDAERALMMATVAPVWDGNETWMILGGALLYAVFPMVYSVVLSALYLPLLSMAMCLIFRGVAFEIRAKSRRSRHLWDLAFVGGSAGATFLQGVVIGSWLSGITVSNDAFAGHAFDWFSAFSVFTGCALVVTYALLGCGWLIMKTQGDLQRRLYRLMWPLTALEVVMIVVVSLWTPSVSPVFTARWFHSSLFPWIAPVPVIVAALAYAMRRAIGRRHDSIPFVLSLAFVVLGFIGLLATVWPFAILPGITVWDAAAPHASQVFTLRGALVVLPVIVAYTTFGYRVFRGKTSHADLHYH